MAFVPEDGTGLPDANSYISVEWADEYFIDRGNAKWTDLDEDKKEIALVEATDYINLKYGTNFRGSLATEDQALLFPRLYVGNSALQMPVTLKRATAEYALRASVSPLAPDFQFDASGRLWTKKREEVGPIVEETSYGSQSVTDMYSFRPYPVPDGLMRSLLSFGSMSGQLLRN